MRVAIVLMKGVDGCGVTRFAIEHQKELRKTGHVCDIFAFNNKYTRTKAHSDLDVNYYSDFTKNDFISYDILLLNSYPKEFNENEFEYFKSLKLKKVAVMHEILRQNIGRIPHIWDWIGACDLVTSFSDEMDFTQDLFEHFPNAHYFSYKMAMSDDEIDSLYNSSFVNKKDRLVYFGRWTTMKDPSRLFLYKKIDPSYDLSMIGIERSIGAKFDILDNELCEYCSVNSGLLSSKDDYDNYQKDFNMVQVFPPTMRNVALDILKESKYGASFYHLKNNRINNLGNRMEYTQIEISTVCLPVFDTDWGKHTIDNLTGKTFYELGDNAIYSDSDNLKDSLDEMKHLSQDEYNIRRKNIYDLIKRNYGSTENIKYFYDQVVNEANLYKPQKKFIVQSLFD